MSRASRITPAGVVFHLVNRAIDGHVLFTDEPDYLGFYRLLLEAGRRYAVRVFAYCLMPNHWHLVLSSLKDQEISAYIQWLSTKHSVRFRRDSGTVGRGHVYQGRFHSFAVQTGRYYYNVIRYVEANALHGGLVVRAEDWPWSSVAARRREPPLTSEGPLPLPMNWLELVNTRLPSPDLAAIKWSETRGRPYGSLLWTTRNARALHLEHTLHGLGAALLSGQAATT